MTAATVIEQIRGLLGALEAQTSRWHPSKDRLVQGMDEGTRTTCDAIRCRLDQLEHEAAGPVRFVCRRCGRHVSRILGNGDRVCSECSRDEYALRREQGRQSWEEEQMEKRDEPVS